MKTLIITAHPSSQGLTHKIAEAYKRGREENGHTVEILDLYKSDIKQDYLFFENAIDIRNENPAKSAMQAKIFEASDIVFVHPMWWMSVPAIMKNFIDVNFSSHFAFKYEKGRPKGLLGGRTSSVFITCDGPQYLYMLIALPFASIWRFGILQFCGLKVNTIKVLYEKFKKTDIEKQAFVDQAYELAKKFN